MKDSKTAAAQFLRLVLCLSLCFPCAWPAAAATALKNVPGRALILGLGLQAPAAPDLAAPLASAALVRHPVLDILKNLQQKGIALPDNASTHADALKLMAAAEALPNVEVRQQLALMARAITTSRGGAPLQAELGRAFDHSFKGGQEPVSAEGFWSRLAGSRWIPNFIGRRLASRVGPGASKSGPVNPRSLEVPAEKLRWQPAGEWLPEGTKEVEAGPKQVVGQDRALQSIRWGLQKPGKNYNLYVAGPEGSGRETAVRQILAELAPKMPTPPDLVAVTNFADEEKPVILELPPGAGNKFETAVARLVRDLKKVLPKALGSDKAMALQRGVERQYNKTVARRQAEWEQAVSKVKLGKFGLTISITQTEDTIDYKPELTYEADGHIHAVPSAEALKELVAQGRFTQEEADEASKLFETASRRFIDKHGVMRRANQRLLDHAMHKAMAKVAGDLIEELGQDLRMVVLSINDHTPAHKEEETASFMAEMSRDPQALHAKDPDPTPAEKAAFAYAEELLAHAKENFEAFLPQEPSKGAPADASEALRRRKTDPKDAYRVSVLVDNGSTQGAPVIFEKNPSYEQLFGTADDNSRGVILPGMAVPISVKSPGGPTLKGGSFLKANGGFLVLDVMDVLQQPEAWPALMQALRNGQAEITEEGLHGVLSMKGEKYNVPETVEKDSDRLRVKVALIGSPVIKMLLSAYDKDFQRLFNASAEFEHTLPITLESVKGCLRFLKQAVADAKERATELAEKTGRAAEEIVEDIFDMSRDAISFILEYQASLAESNEKLSAQFGELHSLMQEASFFAQQAGRRETRREDFEAALDERAAGAGMHQKYYMELLQNRTFVVETEGEQVGQIDGLVVMDAYGAPQRVTLTASAREPGQRILVSTDRDADLTGKSFNKADGVAESFLLGAFAQEKTFPAQLRGSFEQEYGGIDGDSATSTVIYASLSALSGVPIRQRYAVTGSADQFGNIQAIGGVNKKIEGFFALCKHRGLSGQGVIIPQANVGDLMLSPEIVKAVREGKFHVYAISHVSQGMEILTGAAYPEIVRRGHVRLGEMRRAAGKA